MAREIRWFMLKFLSVRRTILGKLLSKSLIQLVQNQHYAWIQLHQKVWVVIGLLKNILDGVNGRMVEGSKTRDSAASWAMELQVV